MVTEVKAEIRMESLLHHTAERLITILGLESDTLVSLKMIVKYGFDGTNSSSYKQRWKNGVGNDDHIFCASIVPLQLLNVDNGQIFWRNPRPSSTRFCRPLLIEFAKETSNLCKEKEADYESQIANLQPYVIGNVIVRFELALTMIDGKVGLQFFWSWVERACSLWALALDMHGRNSFPYTFIHLFICLFVHLFINEVTSMSLGNTSRKDSI